MPALISRGKIQPVTAQHFHKSAVGASEARCSRLLGRMAVSGAGDGKGEGVRGGRNGRHSPQEDGENIQRVRETTSHSQEPKWTDDLMGGGAEGGERYR